MLKEITKEDLALIWGAKDKTFKKINHDLDDAMDYIERTGIVQDRLLYAADNDASLINGTAKLRLEKYKVKYPMSWTAALVGAPALGAGLGAIVGFIIS